MNKTTLQTILALGAATMLAGCGAEKSGAEGENPTPTPTAVPNSGTVAVSYAFQGNEAPSKVRLLVIDGDVSGETCTTLAFAPTSGIVADRPNLPINGTANFTNVSIGTKYLVVALGEKTDGTRIAMDCQDQVNVTGGDTTQVDLSLLNWVGDLNGSYLVAQNINLGLPSQIVTALQVFQAACGFLGNPDLCTIAADVNDIITSMDVVAEWTIDEQIDGTIVGQVKWITVEGIDVGTINLMQGSFVGEIPGSTGVVFKDFDTALQVGNLVLFVVEDVLGYDLGQFGIPGAALINALAGNYVSPLTFEGTGVLTDANHDGINEKINGNLTGHLQVSSFGHDFATDYLATRQ